MVPLFDPYESKNIDIDRFEPITNYLIIESRLVPILAGSTCGIVVTSTRFKGENKA